MLKGHSWLSIKTLEALQLYSWYLGQPYLKDLYTL